LSFTCPPGSGESDDQPTATISTGPAWRTVGFILSVFYLTLYHAGRVRQSADVAV